MINRSYETLERLGRRVAIFPQVLCLLGLGSMAEVNRMDEYSDIDFFLIVEAGFKKRFFESLDWLEVERIVYSFANTLDGYKILFEHGVYAEFAIFEPAELEQAGFSQGRIVYRRSDFDASLVTPKRPPTPWKPALNHVVNEALTNLFVGLQREKRGEHASAFRFIQVYAATSIMHTFPALFLEQPVDVDPYGIDRRIEFRFPEANDTLKELCQGIERNVASAKAALSFLQNHFELNKAMVKAITDLF